MEKYYIGVDVGGMSVKFGIFSSKKKLIDKFQIKLTDDLDILKNHKTTNIKTTRNKKTLSEKEIIDRILNVIENYLQNRFINKNAKTKNDIKKQILGIGFAFPGPVVENKLLKAVNINWKKNYDIVSATKKRFGNNIKVIVLNDANAAALGEYYNGLQNKIKNMAMITLGTGVGGGIIIGGKIVEGKTGIAGEISHITVDFSNEAKKCNCGNYGCLETVASGVGIVNVFNRYFNKEKKDVTARDIKEAAIKGDKNCLKSLKLSLSYLSSVICMLTYVYEPEMVVLGGGVSTNGDLLAHIITSQIKKSLTMTKKIPKVVIGKLINDAGIYGAAALL